MVRSTLIKKLKCTSKCQLELHQALFLSHTDPMVLLSNIKEKRLTFWAVNTKLFPMTDRIHWVFTSAGKTLRAACNLQYHYSNTFQPITVSRDFAFQDI